MLCITWLYTESDTTPSRTLFPTFYPTNFNTRFLNYYKWKSKPKKYESF
jgi:hypothetical protein